MEDNILTRGKQHVNEVRQINRHLTEKALRMRCISYLSRVKEQLLVATIYEIDSSKKELQKATENIIKQKNTINRQKEELLKKNKQLLRFQKELEKLVAERTFELRQANIELKKEINERKQLEKEKDQLREQFLQSQKMESIGRLAGGVAHDFNNLLTAILGYSRLVLGKLPENDPLTRDLNLILNAGKKSAALVRQLLTFSRKQPIEMKVVNLNQIVENMTKLLGRMLGEDLQLDLQLSQPMPNIMADMGQIEQVVLNLVVNARDAMPTGGQLIIETDALYLDTSYSKLHKNVSPGEYSLLSVSDTGIGMSPDIQAKIFEPFFTTKEKDQGTGLGLATVHGIVQQHNGHIYVYSEPGKGTTFKIYFPINSKDQKHIEENEPKTSPCGSETILVVDDDETMRMIIRDTLVPLGYNIFTAASGQEAIDICHSCQQRIHLLLSDVIMPVINGKQLYGSVIEKFPTARVLFMSGYTGKILAQYDIFEENSGFIHKPFSPSELAIKIRNLLDQYQ
jgi:signal transduction histidine kinase